MDRATFRRLARNRQLRHLMASWTAFYTADLVHFTLAVVFTFQVGGAEGVGAATVLNVLPGGLIGPLVTSLGNSNRAQLHLAIGNGGRALMMIATVVAVLSGAPVSVVLALVAVDSLVSAGVRPLHGALIVRLGNTVAEVAAANSATSFLVNAAALIGPALGGVALAVFGIGWAFAVAAAIFAAATVSALMIKLPSHDEAEGDNETERTLVGRAKAEMRAVGAGFRAIVVSPPAAAATILFIVNMTLMGVWWVVLAPVAGEQLRLGDSGITTMLSLDGAGGLFGALVTMTLVGRRRLARIVGEGMLALAVLFAVLGLVGAPALGLALAFGVGAAGAVAYAVAPTLVQRSVDKESMVAAAASQQSLYLLGVAAGGALTPILIRHLGTTATLALLGAAALLTTLLVWPQLRKADVLSAEDAAKLSVIRATPMLAPLPGLAQEQLARAAERMAVPAGSEVIRQGDRGDRYYMIAAGLADVTVDGYRVATLGPRGSFGEIALLHDVPRSATVTAKKDLDLVVLDRAEFLGALGSDAGAVTRLGGLAQTRLTTPPVEERLVELDRDAALGDRSVVDLLASQPPLADLDADAVRTLADAARVVAAPDGAFITREGDHGDTYYVIVGGAVEVLKDDTLLHNLRPGNGFGEHAILRDVPQPATMRALGYTTLVAVDREAFQRAKQGE